VTVTMLLASTLGKIFQPFFDAMAWVIAGFYAVVPNYAIAIALLTVAVMVITAPLTIKSTRSMVAMSKLSPAMKELQKKYKNDKVRLNEEMMKLYREHNVSPAAGCVPMLLQFPIFIILYDVIEGLTNTVRVHGRVVAEPRYVGHSTALYQSLVHHPGVMNSFGVNLADTAFSHLTWPGRLPYIGMILIAIGLQYFQMRQINKRNQNQLNQQMQAMQKFMPLIFAIIYIRIAAGVNVYFIVSSLCRIGLQLWSFRSTPADAAPRVGTLAGGTSSGRKRKTLMERLAEAQQRALEQQAQQRALAGGTGGPIRSAGGGRAGAASPAASSNGRNGNAAPTSANARSRSATNGVRPGTQSARPTAGQRPAGGKGTGNGAADRRPSRARNGAGIVRPAPDTPVRQAATARPGKGKRSGGNAGKAR
jgi:YidC/Oxa1 family membrane protein insertase